MSPLEELREHIHDNQSVHLALGNNEGLDRNTSWLAALNTLIAERDALRKALEPFAKEGVKYAKYPWNIKPWEDCKITAGDLRRAHAALHGTEASKPKTCGECASLRPNGKCFDFRPGHSIIANPNGNAPKCFQPRDGAEEVKP